MSNTQTVDVVPPFRANVRAAFEKQPADREVPIKTQGGDLTMTSPTEFAPSDARHDYTATPPGRVSANLIRLFEEAKIGPETVGKSIKIGKSTIRRFLHGYEPPTNHPMLHDIASVLATKLRRPTTQVLSEIVDGGAPVKFTKYQWQRITGEIGRRSTAQADILARTKPVGKTRPKAQPKTPAKAPSMTTEAVRRRAAATAVEPASDLRTMVTTINIARMKGDKFLTVPIDTVTELTVAALKARGLKTEGVLLQADFADTF
jgi:hypothetical protein